MLCAEGCITIAISKKKNTYEIMRKLSKKDGQWRVIDTNTYRTHKNVTIINIQH